MLKVKAGDLEIILNEKGKITSFGSVNDCTEYIAAEQASYFLRIITDGKMFDPTSASWDEDLKVLTLAYDSIQTAISIEIEEKDSYAVFEVVKVCGNSIDLILWGPYATTINGSVGETIGVVHDNSFAIGIQALNIKTIGGWPVEYNAMGFAGHNRGETRFPYHVSAASRTNWGSVLQAYVRNRTKDSVREVWNLADIPVKALTGKDAELEGTKIALFGCNVKKVLDTISNIEICEHLPHPVIDGEWGKTAYAARQSYFITEFSEENVAKAIEAAKKAGMKYIYHAGPFENWGHFDLRPDHFPDRDESLKRCVEAAGREGIYVGVHTLTNFTTLNDPFVTPVPDDGLQKVGTAKLAAPVDECAEEIYIDDPKAFRETLYQYSAIIGNEIVEYEAVSETAPWKLTGCMRGVNGTQAASHETGENIGRLWDHPYNVFFPDINLQSKFTSRIVELFNKCGLRQISFDGLEGCYATGHEDYAVNKFVKDCYDGWKMDVINDASLLTHFLWHIHTRMNWGEPWGAAMREGQLEGRLGNQRYFERNFFPKMLGWFLIRSAEENLEATTLDDIEWMLSKAAGFDSGFALTIWMDVLERNGNIDLLLNTIHSWEQARMSGAFTEEQKLRLSEAGSEWHLEEAGECKWKLYPVEVSKTLTCNPVELQPGQPGGADWRFTNNYSDQPLSFRMRVVSANGSGSVKKPSVYIDGHYMTFNTEIMSGQYLVCEGSRIGKVYDSNWNLVKTVNANNEPPILKNGEQGVSFSGRFEGNPRPKLEMKIFTYGNAESVEAK